MISLAAGRFKTVACSEKNAAKRTLRKKRTGAGHGIAVVGLGASLDELGQEGQLQLLGGEAAAHDLEDAVAGGIDASLVDATGQDLFGHAVLAAIVVALLRAGHVAGGALGAAEEGADAAEVLHALAECVCALVLEALQVLRGAETNY